MNVGDIKPAEYHITLFMDMAYDIHSFNYDNINVHSVDFLCRMFGEKYRADFTDIQQTYFQLAFAENRNIWSVARIRNSRFKIIEK